MLNGAKITAIDSAKWYPIGMTETLALAPLIAENVKRENETRRLNG